MKSEVHDKVRQLADEVAKREGVQVYEMEWLSGPRSTLRIYVDGVDHAATLDDCVRVSQGLSLLLDVEADLGESPFDLEVSTPGLERKLSKPWHFARALGERARVRVHWDEETRTVEGRLAELHGDTVLLVEPETGREWRFRMDQVERAHLVFKPEAQPKKKMKKQRPKQADGAR